MNTKDLLIVFAKNPEAGKVKTRLAQEVGDTKALEIYKALLNHTRGITGSLTCDKAVFYADEIEVNDLWDEQIYQKYLQSGKSLGERMKEAFRVGFDAGYKRVIIIGTDCMMLQPMHIENGFQMLKVFDFVIGPAKDGGYYLMGMEEFHEPLFDDKAWSSNTVLYDTLKDIDDAGMNYKLLPELQDIDYLNDIPKDSQLLSILNNKQL